MNPLDKLVAMLRACGAEKLPGRLSVNEPEAADIRQALAYLRGELDQIEGVLVVSQSAESLSPFEVETLRVIRFPPGNEEWVEFHDSTEWPRILSAVKRLMRDGLVDASWDITDAGCAVLADLGVT